MHIIEEFWGPDAPRALPLKLESLLAVHLGWFGYMGHCEWTNRWSPPKKNPKRIGHGNLGSNRPPEDERRLSFLGYTPETRWWFSIFCIFTPILENDPI